jgi:hypothetical protein
MTDPKPNLRWFQFSLRTLLVVVTLCALLCSWFAVKMQQAKRQREAVEAITKVGGRAMYDWQVDANGNYVRNAQPPATKWLRNLLGDDFFGRVVEVEFDDTKVTDEVLIKVRQELPNCKIRYKAKLWTG